MALRVAIIEDEQLSLSRIQKLIAEFDELILVGVAENGNDALQLINNKKPDLIFLDIKIPGLNGIQVLRQADHKPLTIFITAYDEYAVSAFELDAMDYLLKPFTADRFNKAVEKALKALENGQPKVQELMKFLENYYVPNKYLDRITLNVGYVYKTFHVDEIDLFGRREGEVFLIINGEKYPMEVTLSKLEEELNPNKFFRAHRNSLVNLDRIQKIDVWGRRHHTLKFAGDETVHLSREKIAAFKEIMGFHS